MISKMSYDELEATLSGAYHNGDWQKVDMTLHEMVRVRKDYTFVFKMLMRYQVQRYHVYKLLLDNVVVYVGQSTKPLNRVYAHSKDKNFSSVQIATLGDKSSALQFEAMEIDRYKPKYNKVNKLFREGEMKITTDYVDMLDYINSKVVFDQSEYSSIFKFNIRCKTHHLTEVRCGTDKNGGWHAYSNYRVKNNLNVLPFSYEEGCFIKNEITKEEPEELNFDDIEHLLISTGIYQVGDIIFTKKGKWRYSWSNEWKRRKPYLSYKAGMKRAKEQEKLAKDKVLWFGKYKGKRLTEIEDSNPEYIDWMKKNLDKGSLVKLGLWEEPVVSEQQERNQRVRDTMKEISKKTGVPLNKLPRF